MADSLTRFHILRVLLPGPSYPYRMALAISQSTQGRVVLEAGNLHRRLQQLLAEGLIREVELSRTAQDRRRRYFALTPAGRRALMAGLERMQTAVRLARAGLAGQRT
jgi:DNA-binding PadR family transcriptional regulator